jgi:hypothetical protein
MTAKKIIENHYNNKTDFFNPVHQTKYSDDKQTQNVTAEIRIKKR